MPTLESSMLSGNRNVRQSNATVRQLDLPIAYALAYAVRRSGNLGGAWDNKGMPGRLVRTELRQLRDTPAESEGKKLQECRPW